jgi:hypothetical protein
MLRPLIRLLAVALTLQAQEATLTLELVEGEGVIYQPGSRSARGVTVDVVDASGAKVSGATVSFQLPESGATGTFASGGRTEIATTGADGRASAWGMRWGAMEGDVAIRITAARGPVRASRVVHVTLARTVGAQKNQTTQTHSGSSRKWLWITLAVAGAAGGGLAATGGLAGGSKSATATVPVPTLTIGTPSISIVRP